ncbi:methionyl-tRNA formyltransferase [Halomarina rubra]|uniref:Methionyl-tRNA formyltransferase n=1 Tax=Halomarina rubra TaxID=2071873 RepID=A0ABD6AWY5_9EURY|nr:methionyl-tRNA formyltransferase [Halomarina rubra]
MRVVFVTHNDLGLACLEELVDLGADVRAVFTRPRREAISDQTDLSRFAAVHDLPLHETDDVNDEAVRERIAEYDPELLFVVGWSRLVDPAVFDLASVAALGMHPAPLPRGRGRAPIAWSLIKGLDETALSFFHLVAEADAGDLVGQEPIPIAETDDAGSLYAKVVEAGRTLIRESYPRFEAGEVPREPQDDTEATWWPKRVPRHGLVDWTRPAHELYDWIRGQTHPYPGAFSTLHGHEVRFWAAHPPTGERVFCEPGELLAADGETLRVGTWEGAIDLTRVGVDGVEIPASDLLDEEWASLGDCFANARDLLGDGS